MEIEVNDSNFEEKVIKQSEKIPVLVDFWAEWCAPCRRLSPTLEKLAKEYEGRVILAEAKTDETRVASQKYGIMSIPNVKLFKNGKIADEFVGAYPEEDVKEFFEKNL